MDMFLIQQRKLSKKGFASAGKSALLFEPESIVISKSGTIGRLGIIKDFMCGNRATINIKAKRKFADNKYIFYYLLKNQAEIEDMAVGSVQRNLYTSVLGAISLSLPPLPEQKAIAATLFCLDDKIELNNRINKTLEEMAQTIFKSWFVDFEPFLDGDFEDSELGRIPKGWRIRRFTEVTEVYGGGTPKTNIPSYWNGNIPFFTPKDCSNSFYVMDTEKTITLEGLQHCNSKLYPKNAVFVTARGTVGKICLAICNMAMNQSCYALIGSNGYSQYLIQQLTLNLVDKFKHKARYCSGR
ncbi:MAG: restriction endonuclease subunit S [Syntrophomonadaceae bacterium]|nr:restriction endonuclease subunit S [Syntrophomonadaceae bacterium]